MKSTNKNTLSLTAIRIVFPLCLALNWLSEPAAAGITYGSETGPTICNSTNNQCSSDTRLGVGPGPGSGGRPINPADYGMCGVLNLSGAFNNSTVARIIVGADGYYHVHTSWVGIPTAGPHLEWTCVLFTDFTGLPLDYVAGLGTYQPPPVIAKSGGRATNMIGPSDACIWAGLAGSLSSTDSTPVSVFAQFDASYTFVSAQSAPKTTIETYAFCNSILGFPWAPYLNSVVVPALGSTGGVLFPVKFPAPGSKPGVIGSRWWCYMDGVGTSAGASGTSAAEKFSSAGLGFVTPDSYYFGVGKESALWFNCMGLEQAPLTF